jgi:hypothetical protein
MYRTMYVRRSLLVARLALTTTDTHLLSIRDLKSKTSRMMRLEHHVIPQEQHTRHKSKHLFEAITSKASKLPP